MEVHCSSVVGSSIGSNIFWTFQILEIYGMFSALLILSLQFRLGGWRVDLRVYAE